MAKEDSAGLTEALDGLGKVSGRLGHKKRGNKIWLIVGVFVVVLAVFALFVLMAPGGVEANESFSGEGSYECVGIGRHYFIMDGVAAYADGENVAVTYGSNKYVGFPDGKWVKAKPDDLGAYLGISCHESAVAAEKVSALFSNTSVEIGGARVLVGDFPSNGIYEFPMV